MLSALNEALQSIEGNWQGATAVRTFIALAARLVSLTPSDVIREGCFLFLRRTREVARCWTRDLSEKFRHELNEARRRDLSAQSVEVALTCYGTFGVEARHVYRVLHSDEDIAVATECSLIVYDYCPSLLSCLTQSLATLIYRFLRLSHALEPVLRAQILTHCVGLDSTVRRHWDGYQPKLRWTSSQYT